MGGKHIALPDELLVAIFLRLDVPSINACQHTCQRFRCIIEDSVNVQYHVELQLACMQNVPASDMSITSRLSMLRAQGRAWEALSWSTPEPVVLPTPPGVTKWKLVGGFLCVDGPGFIQCIRLPSPIRGTGQREWRIDHTCGENDLKWDFCHDPSQDLLVLFEEFKLRCVPCFLYCSPKARMKLGHEAMRKSHTRCSRSTCSLYLRAHLIPQLLVRCCSTQLNSGAGTLTQLQQRTTEIYHMGLGIRADENGNLLHS